jgi:hypothetical protein
MEQLGKFGQSKIIDFYLGIDPKWNPADILMWKADQLENNCLYIQWLFPLPEPSRFNPEAPLLTENDIFYFKNSKILRQCLLESFERMLWFYGFYVDNSKIKRRGIGSDKKLMQWWMNPGNHNYLRITRILRCLMLCGLEEEAQEFYGILKNLYVIYPDMIEKRAFDFWTEAVGIVEKEV